MANNIIGTVGVGAQSVKPDWNQNDPNAKDYIKNRPGGYVIPPSVEITWDGDTTGKETVDMGSGNAFVKIADEAPSIEKFVVGEEKSGPRYAATITADLTYSDNNTKTEQFEIKLQAGDGFWGGNKEGCGVLGVVADHVSLEGATFSKGLWVSASEEVEK